MSPAMLQIGDETGPGQVFCRIEVAPVHEYGGVLSKRNLYLSAVCIL